MEEGERGEVGEEGSENEELVILDPTHVSISLILYLSLLWIVTFSR